MTGQILAAALAYAAVLVSAVETFFRGSPVRWWIVGIVAVYAVVTAVFWRRTSRRLPPVASLLVFTGMLAVTAWLPGGLDNGVRLLGLSTSALLTLAAVAGITLAAFVLWHTTRLPVVVRALVAVLAAYGVISFVYGLVTGVPFAALLSDDSFFRTMPFLLQGAAVGGLIVLPAALVVALIRIGTRRPDPGSSGHTLNQVVALATSFAIVLAALPQRPNASSPSSPSRAGNDAARRLAIVDNSLRAIEDGDRESPRDRWDPAYVVEQVGKDPQALSAWVRNNTVWIPYRGILRGATGVLMDRQGNSLDRAILLATLFEKAGHKPRLAYRELSDADALIRATSASGVPRESAVPLEGVGAVAEGYGLDPAAVTRTVEAHNQAAIQIANELDLRLADQARRLLKAVARPDPRVEWQKRIDDAVSAGREHWWVQLDSAGAWTDFDVDQTAARPEGGTAERTALVKDLAGAGMHHQIVVRVVAEQWSKRTVAERTVMEHTLRPAEVIGKPIVLQFLPKSALRDSPPTTTPVDLAVEEQQGWNVYLTVGPDVVAAGIVERRVSGGGPLGGLGAAIANMAGTNDRELSAVWLEYEFRVPDESPQTIRRTMFDLVGPAARAAGSPALTVDSRRELERSLALTQRTELLPIACRLSQGFVRHILAENLVSNRNLLRIAVQNFDSLPDQSLTAVLEAAVPPVTPLYSLALARLNWSADEQSVYINRAGLLTAHTRFVREGTQTMVKTATDIVANPIGISLSVRDAFSLRLAHGVLDTNAETYLHSFAMPAENTADAFALPNEWVALGAGDTDAIAQVQLGDDVRQRIRDDLAAGSIVVAPKSPVQTNGRPFSGWWRIDPATGHTLGVAANGWGTAGEYTSLQARNFVVRDTLRKAGLRAFWVFNTTAGFCLVQELVTSVEKTKHPWTGFKAVPVENANQCAYQGLFWGAVAALPLVVMTVNIRLTAVAPRIGGVAGEAAAASESAAAAAESEAAGAVGPGRENAAAGEAAPGASPRGGSVPPPAPKAGSQPPSSRPSAPPPRRSLSEIEADIEAAEKNAKAADDNLRPHADNQARQGPGKRGDVKSSKEYDDFLKALEEKIDAEERVHKLRNEYAENGGAFDANGKPAGKWVPEISSEGVFSDAPPNPGQIPGSGGSTLDLGKTQPDVKTQPDLGATLPGGRPGPVYAPVRHGAPNPRPPQTTVVGLGGLGGTN